MYNKDWKIENGNEVVVCDGLKKYSPLLLKILSNRGLVKEEEIRQFLEAEYDEDSFNPFLFVDMEKSISLLIGHIKSKNKICVYGDYDADGVSSSVLLVDILRLLNVNVDFYIPDRVSEGYGINMEALNKIIADGVKLVITVDNGIRNKEEVDFAIKNGVDVIITDHHQGPLDEKDYPDCLIINPALPRENLPYNRLAGVGVVLKFVEALLRMSTLSDKQKEMIRSTLFDLAAIGTVADCVSLTGDNRMIVKKGLKVLSKTKRLGLKELIKVANIKNSDELDSWNIGFQIAPRINAAGRMDHANTAFALLLSKDKEESRALAQELDYNNKMRQKSTEKIFESVEAQILSNPNEYLLSAFYEYKEGEEHEPWNEGIVGLVSGKVTERYYRPSVIITKTHDGYKGSGRSIAEFNISKALELSREHLVKYGGHPLACGFSLKDEKLNDFIASMKRIAEQELAQKDLRPTIRIDSEIEFSDISQKLADELSILKPFGQDNPQPVFLSRKIQVLDKISLGMNSQHVKLRLKNGSSNIISAIGFGQSDKWKFISIGDLIDIVYHLEINEFNGRREVQLKIIDIQKNGGNK